MSRTDPNYFTKRVLYFYPSRMEGGVAVVPGSYAHSALWGEPRALPSDTEVVAWDRAGKRRLVRTEYMGREYFAWIYPDDLKRTVGRSR